MTQKDLIHFNSLLKTPQQFSTGKSEKPFEYYLYILETNRLVQENKV